MLALLWLSVSLILWNNARDSVLVRFLLSPKATLSAIVTFLALCLWVGFSGDRDFASSILFILVLLYLQTVLLFVILRGWRSGNNIRLRFILTHCGLLLALASAFWGAPDSRTIRLKCMEGVSTNEAFAMDGSSIWLPYQLLLVDFDLQVSEDETVSDFEALVEVDDVPVVLKVNHPHKISFGEDLYLTGYDTQSGSDPEYCILQIVREPWKYSALFGIIMMLAGAFLLFVKGPVKPKRV